MNLLTDCDLTHRLILTTVSGERYLLGMKTRLICPACNSPEVKEIAYGFPGSEFDFDKYEVGGCCVTDNDPDFKCMKCETTW
ncbi:MAG: hypothetical protein EBX59_02395 [Betaproteobacteria bacterium]|nr:hypothetical protein [Betaproteobacteria bacterium]